MEFIIGFLLTLFKVAIQASLYATLLQLLTRLADAQQVNYAWVRASRNSKKFWRRCWLGAYAVLCLFANTYWGDHGLGDSARIPLGHGETMEEINGTDAYFEPASQFEKPSDNPEVISYQVARSILCAKETETFYFVYDLESKRAHTFVSAEEYNTYATKWELPSTSHFQSFHKHYSQYWGGWRFWLLA